MLLIAMMAWCMSFRNSNPVFPQTNPGQYVEIVNPQYDAGANQTYAVVVRYGVEAGQAPYVDFLQPRPFTGKPTQKEMLKTIIADPYIKIVD